MAGLLGLARIVIGAGVWMAPREAMAALGFDADAETLALGRLVGTRDIALGALAVAMASDPQRGPVVARVNALTDAGDAAVFVGALVRREGIDRAAVMGALGAAAATGLGLWLAAQLEE